MKRLVMFIIFTSTFLGAQAQDTLPRRASYIGLDVINSLPSIIFPKNYYIRNAAIIEPYYLLDLKKPGRRLYLGAGFASGSTHQYADFDPSQAFRGAYVRAAYEIRRMRSTRRILYAGYGPVISIAGYEGTYRFEGLHSAIMKVDLEKQTMSQWVSKAISGSISNWQITGSCV